MSKEYKNRKKRKGRRELIEENRRLVRDCELEKYRAERAEEDAEKQKKRIREIGIKCVDPLHGGRLECKTVVPTPFGCYSVISNGFVQNTDELIEYAKQDLVRSIAQMLLDENLVQFIIHKAGDPGFNPLDQTTVGAKFYVIPWEKLSVWKDGVTIGNIRRYQEGW